jgi:hypothetical protein
MENTQTPVQETQELPKDLQDKLTSLKALASIHHLINNSSFKTNQFSQVDAAISFITILHGEMMKDAASHESADQVPELVQYKQQSNG